MSRFCLSLSCALGILLLASAPAHAWWDFIEQLSGPGPFYGWDVEVRLFCVVDKIDTTPGNERVLPADPHPRSAVGVLVSACTVPKRKDKASPTYHTRRLAIDVGARVMWADDNPQFANGQRISLTTLEPSITINLLSRWPNKDFVDYAFGAGAFWFSSTEFPSFSGAFLEPVRFEFHTTTKMKENKWVALVPSVRVGYLMFPSGFETARFAAAPGVAPRISRDWVFNAGVFFDLEGLFR